MDFNRLLTFHTVANRLSFSRAAEDLYTSQPNVSRQIATLESELGLPLFQRMGNKVALTDAGRMLEDYAQRTFELTDRLQRSLNELKGLERGYLRLAAGSISGLYVLPQAIAGFTRQHPGLHITIYVGNSQEALARVLSNDADLAFVDTTLSGPALQVQPYAHDELVLCVSPAHPLAHQAPVRAEDIEHETILWREQGSSTRQATEEALAQWGLTPEHTLVVNHTEALKQTVMAGLGVAFLSRRAINLELQQKVLAIAGEDGWRIPLTLAIASRKDIRPPMTALSFLAYIHKQG